MESCYKRGRAILKVALYDFYSIELKIEVAEYASKSFHSKHFSCYKRGRAILKVVLYGTYFLIFSPYIRGRVII